MVVEVWGRVEAPDMVEVRVDVVLKVVRVVRGREQAGKGSFR